VVVSQSPRITNSTLVFSSSSSPLVSSPPPHHHDHDHHHGQYATLINGLQKTTSSWGPSGHSDTDDLLGDNQNLHDSLGRFTDIALFSYNIAWYFWPKHMVGLFL